MAGKAPRRNPVPLSDLAAAVLDPVLRKRAGISIALVQSWGEIVGPLLAPVSRPERIRWPRRRHEDEPFQPAVLVIACTGAAALHIQHQTGEIIGRVNTFLGFPAVGGIRIVQKPLAAAPERRKPGLRPLSRAERERLAGTLADIEDDSLRAALERLGQTVIGSHGPKG